MQSKALNIPCPTHPSENIQRVNIDNRTSKHLYCLECVLDQQEIRGPNFELKTIQDFMSFASDFYEQNKQTFRPLSEGANPFGSKVVKQDEEIVRFSEHIVSEKEKTEYFFSQIASELMSFLEEKKLYYLNTLDQQYNNFIHWYKYCDKRFRKAFPTSEDMPNLFPSKDKLEKELSKISDFGALDSFIRSIKEDLSEGNKKESSDSRDQELDGLVKKLEEITARLPSFSIENINLDELTATMKKNTISLLEKSLVLKDPIISVNQNNMKINSQIINAKDYQLVKEWLPPRYQDMYPELLYSSSRDGKEAKTFHDKCDEKGPTITIFKCKVDDNPEEKILGGFLDKDWNSSGTAIPSKEAFIFSITAGIKCPILPSAISAAYGNPMFGPAFSMDLKVDSHHFENDVFQVSYENSSKLFESEKQAKSNVTPSLSPQVNFNLGGGGLPGGPGQFPFIPPPDLKRIERQGLKFPLNPPIGQMQPMPIKFPPPSPNEVMKWAKDNKVVLPGQPPNLQMQQSPLQLMMANKKLLRTSEVEVFGLKLL